MAAADFYVGNRGLISFIVSDSFCHLLSYRYFRADLLRHYHVRSLIRLGTSVFQDVGPRISFVIVILEKRAEALADLSETEELPYIDLRDLVSTAPPEILGTEADPRLVLLKQLADSTVQLPSALNHKPDQSTGFSLYPGGAVVKRVTLGSVPVYEKKKDRIFLDKWPGIITAFDDLLKSNDAAALGARISSLFALANRRTVTGAKLFRELETWAKEHDIDSDQVDRLSDVIAQIRGSKLQFSRANIKRAIDGSAPNLTRWYPPKSNRVFIYFEPTFRFRRNINEGKAVGWGDMQQWREATSHTISPKLIYTTGTKTNYGLKAFVVDDEWYVKLHGGTSQQYHYTGILDPQKALRTDGLPNNLTDQGHAIVQALSKEGLPAEAALFYVAAIYNSEIAADFLEEGGSPTTFGIKIPTDAASIKRAAKIASLGQSLRNLHWILREDEDASSFKADFIESIFPAPAIKRLGLIRRTLGGGRFKTSFEYERPKDFDARVGSAIHNFQSRLEVLVTDMYP